MMSWCCLFSHLSNSFLSTSSVTFVEANFDILLAEDSGKYFILFLRQQHSTFFDGDLIINSKAHFIGSLIVIFVSFIQTISVVPIAVLLFELS